MKICQRSVLINFDEAYIEIQKFIYNFITVHPIYGCGEMRLSALESDTYKYSDTNNSSRFILFDIFLFDCSKVYTIPETPSALGHCHCVALNITKGESIRYSTQCMPINAFSVCVCTSFHSLLLRLWLLQ